MDGPYDHERELGLARAWSLQQYRELRALAAPKIAAKQATEPHDPILHHRFFAAIDLGFPSMEEWGEFEARCEAEIQEAIEDGLIDC